MSRVDNVRRYAQYVPDIVINGGRMRDGIFKDLPLSRKWRDAVKTCLNEADRHLLGPARIEHALWDDFKKESVPRLLAAFRQREAFQADLLDLREPNDATPWMPPFMMGALQTDVCSYLNDYLASGWAPGPEVIEAALTDAAHEWLGRMRRQVEAHILNHKEESPAIREAVRSVFQQVDCGAFARKACDPNHKPSKRMPRRNKIGLDEDLTA